MKKAIIVLTRGYAEEKDYNQLIERHKHISLNLEDKQIPIIIFNEGNISDEHQQYIKDKQHDLNINFVNITKTSFLKEKETVEIDPRGKDFGWGYRHMCNFWFKDFFEYVKEYDYVLRVDEDCYVKFSIDRAFSEIENGNIPFLYGFVFADPGWVVKTMNQTTIDFMRLKGKTAGARRPFGPYTNVFGLNLIKIREKMDILSEYHQFIDKSNGIYKYRWGDLPLWGEIMYYIFGIECNNESYIKRWMLYYHKSHGKNVNAKYNQ